MKARRRIITTLTAFYASFCLSSTSYASDAAPEPPESPVAAIHDAGDAETLAELPEAPEASESDAGMESSPAVSTPAPDVGIVKDLYNAAKGGDWRGFAILLLMLMVAVTRWFATKWDPLDRLLNGEGDWYGALLVFGLSFLGAFANAWKVDEAFNLALFQAAWQNALLAFGGYSVVWKKLIKPKLGFLD